MKPFEINKTSWHYRLVTHWKTWNPYDERDFCTYASAVFWTLVSCLSIASLCGALVMLASMMVVDFVLGIYFYFTTGFMLMGEPGTAFCAVLIIGIFLWSFVFFADMKSKVKAPTFVGTAWRTFKGKYCIPIVIKD